MNQAVSTVAFVLAMLAGFVLLAVFALAQMTDQPWLGVRFKVGGSDSQVLVAEVASNGSAAGKLQAGQQVAALGDGHKRVALDGQLLASPDTLPTYAAFNAYLREHQQVAEMLAGETVSLWLADGGMVTLKPQPRHPFGSIPWLYPAYLLAGFFCASVGLLLWRYRAGLVVSRVVLVTNLAALLSFLSAVLQYRELALPAEWMRMTAAANMLAGNLSAWGYLAVFMLYPLRVFSNRAVLLSLAVMLLLSLNNIMQWVELPFHTYLLHFLLLIVLIHILLFWQWHITQRQPVEHATVRLFAMVMAIPVVPVVLMWMIPVILGEQVLFPEAFVRFIFIPLAIGWAIAVLRYHLFNIEWWWYVSVMWLVGVSVVMIPYVIFVYLLDFKPLLALTITLLTAVFLYFPIEQKAILRVRYELPSSADTAVSMLVETLHTATNDKDYQDLWRKTLEQSFQPVSVRYLAEKRGSASFENEGVVLCVPDIVGDGSYELTGKQRGNWLFNSRDVQVVESLLTLTRAILRATHAREEATLAERTRIMRDLHDSLGAKLLAMAQRCRGQPSENEAREALQALRDTVHLSTVAEPLDLVALQGEGRLETRERVEIADARLHWQEEGIGKRLEARSAQVLLLRSFLREAVSNALKHAQPGNVWVEVGSAGGWLTLRVGNDGNVTDPASWRLGFGLGHLRERLVRVGGELQLVREGDDRVLVLWVGAKVRL